MLWQKVRSYLDYWKQQHLDKKIKLFISVKKKEDDEVFQKGVELALTTLPDIYIWVGTKPSNKKCLQSC